MVGEVMPSALGEQFCASCCPYVPSNVIEMVFYINWVCPGVGTVIASYFDPSGMNRKCFVCGILQLILTPFVVGWVWSVLMGYAIRRKSLEYQQT